MIESGIVIDKNGGMKVRIERSVGNDCGGCTQCKRKENEYIIEVDEEYDFLIGDRVNVIIPSSGYLFVLFSVYILPLLFLLPGYSILRKFISGEILPMFLSISLCLLAIFLIIKEQHLLKKHFLKIRLDKFE